MLFAQILLALNALGFAFFGTLLLLNPKKAEPWLGIELASPSGATEIRAFYGGLEIGLAALLGLCLLRPGWLHFGLLATILVLAGVVLGRIFGMVVDRSSGPKMWSFLAYELGFLALCLVALLQLP